MNDTTNPAAKLQCIDDCCRLLPSESADQLMDALSCVFFFFITGAFTYRHVLVHNNPKHFAANAIYVVRFIGLLPIDDKGGLMYNLKTAIGTMLSIIKACDPVLETHFVVSWLKNKLGVLGAPQ